ncbi:hypothetical protein SO802_028546 [Lithocarpus litseifolius]|uniref:RNase H type-1 domain-containing protein n=1 Tax=Lithocarpus litseifolius TaxID=425828 RepID=A0AAW2BT39_9ROSI
MGFRNLQAFNLALLAKQGWRILSNPNSLLAKVYKAKYFPYDDILNAKLGSNPSYAWRSIYNSLEVIRKGTRWRVGNGKRIHIWEDKWLPTPSTHKVISTPRDFDDFPMVSSLIDANSKWWKPDLVKALFLQSEASEILKIPLNLNLPEDSLIWLGNRRGSFLVKSAYYVAKELVEFEAACASSSNHLASPFWKKIWHVNAPPKIKIFAWRVCLDALPTMLNLRRRGLNTAGFCQICDKELESISHALFHCNHAKQTWSCWSDCPVNLYSPTCDFIDITSQIMEKGSSSDLGLLLMVTWSIWGIGTMPFIMMLAALLLKFGRLLKGFHKINVDGATNNNGNHSSIRVIIRDHTGATIDALNKSLPSAFPAPTIEAFALLQGVLFAVEMGLTRVIFESDDLALIQAVNSNENGGDLGHILQDIKAQALVFNWSIFQHLKRDGNKAAHELARDAKLTGHSRTWKGVSPPFIHQILIEDML